MRAQTRAGAGWGRWQAGAPAAPAAAGCRALAAQSSRWRRPGRAQSRRRRWRSARTARPPAAARLQSKGGAEVWRSMSGGRRRRRQCGGERGGKLDGLQASQKAVCMECRGSSRQRERTLVGHGCRCSAAHWQAATDRARAFHTQWKPIQHRERSHVAGEGRGGPAGQWGAHTSPSAQPVVSFAPPIGARSIVESWKPEEALGGPVASCSHCTAAGPAPGALGWQHQLRRWSCPTISALPSARSWRRASTPPLARRCRRACPPRCPNPRRWPC